MRHLIFGSLLATTPAWAQPSRTLAENAPQETPPDEPKPPDPETQSANPWIPPRDGFSYGIALGVGSMDLSCDAREERVRTVPGARRGGGTFFSMAARGGWWVSPKTVVMSAELFWSLISFGNEKLDDSEEEIELILGALGQVYLAPIVWLGGGGGMAIYAPPLPRASTAAGPGFIAAGGVHAGPVEIQLRGVVGVYEDYGTRSVVLMIGGSA